MEKKSIGQFISALRKANGMTQKQLSEILNVSDKAVSRWERDECAPDLSLIPVIADVFGVTSDEILRGERRISETSESECSTVSTRSVKQIDHLLKNVELKFNIRSIISSGIAFAGLLCAMLFNFGLFKAHIGFISACVFYLAAVVCQIIFTKLAFSAVSLEECIHENIEHCKKRLFNGVLKVCIFIFALFSVTLPILVLVPDPNLSLQASSWLFYGIILLVIVLFLYVLMNIFAERVALKAKVYSLTEIEQILSDKKFRFDVKFLKVLSCVVLASIVVHIVVSASLSVEMVSEGKKFYSVDSFVEYMETPYKNAYSETISYVGQSGHEVSELQYFRWDFLDPNGNVIATYSCKNENVARWSTEWDGDDVTVTVYTVDDVRELYAVGNFINSVFAVIYVVEVVLISLIWIIRKKKIS